MLLRLPCWQLHSTRVIDGRDGLCAVEVLHQLAPAAPPTAPASCTSNVLPPFAQPAPGGQHLWQLGSTACGVHRCMPHQGQTDALQVLLSWPAGGLAGWLLLLLVCLCLQQGTGCCLCGWLLLLLLLSSGVCSNALIVACVAACCCCCCCCHFQVPATQQGSQGVWQGL
jgi:hypothetical protein